jgi:hypothetical protein
MIITADPDKDTFFTIRNKKTEISSAEIFLVVDHKGVPSFPQGPVRGVIACGVSCAGVYRPIYRLAIIAAKQLRNNGMNPPNAKDQQAGALPDRKT